MHSRYLPDIPVRNSEGVVHFMPRTAAAKAVQAGAQVVVKVADPRGDIRWCPTDKLETAILAGGRVIGVSER